MKVYRHITSCTAFLSTNLFMLFLFISLFAKAQPDTSYKVFYGLLHAHTLISDGSGTPAEAYTMAKNNGLDFFALTPHNHADAEQGAKAERKDGVMIALNHALYNGAGNVTVTRRWNDNGPHTQNITVKPLIKAATDATTQNFVALYGQEFSSISKGNHVNVFGTDEVLEVVNGDFSSLLAVLKGIEATGRTPVLQMNHPDVHEDLFYRGSNAEMIRNMYNDYGIDEGDLGPHFRDLVKSLDPYIHIIELLSGPAMAKTRNASFHYDANENDYYFYLKQGFHISPSAGQDNHYKTWGNVTDARTGIVSKSLSASDIYEAIKKNRTFATEDKNLKVLLYINDSLMGSFAKATEESELNIKILIKDADEPDADYVVSLYRGQLTPQSSKQATEWKAKDGYVDTIEVKGNGFYTFPGVFAEAAPSFYYIKVEQNNSDRAWTAPVWVNDQPASSGGSENASMFFWTSSTSSHVYHIAGCSSIARIKPENLLSGTTPPAGRTQHNCKIEEPDTH